ncbi:MAG: bifunctional pyr operon transcriptional regulator/uracil phosphoribosyltransferase PyrR [Ferruginibacter sp.]
MQILLSADQLRLTITRIAHQAVENYTSLKEVVFIGIQPRGTYISQRMVPVIQDVFPNEKIQYGYWISHFTETISRRNYIRRMKRIFLFSIENKTVILIDDVLYTGRTTRAALDALQDFGRPKKVELCVLIDRRFNRELPIQPDYFGKSIDTQSSQKVKINQETEEVILY